MKHDWEYKKLSEVCDFQGGSQPPKDEWIKEEKEGYVRMLQIRDFTQSRGFEIEYIKQTKSTKYCKEDDILLARYGASVGKVLWGKSGAYNVAIMKAIPDENLVSKAYIRYYFQSGYFQTNLLSLSVGRAAQAGFSKDDIKDFVVPVPSLPDQKQICSLLDKLNLVIEKKKQQVKELDNLAQSIFYDMFGDPVENEKGWQLSTLGDLSTEKLSYGSGASAIDFNGDVRYVRITDIDDMGSLGNDLKSPDVFDEKYLLNEGDILFARSGATVGKTYCHSTKNGKSVYAGYLIRMVPDQKKVLPKYIFYYTKSNYYKGFVLSAQNAVAQPNINAKQYSGLLVQVPPLSIQQSFAEKVESIERQKELINQSIREAQTLFDSRMDYYFGE